MWGGFFLLLWLLEYAIAYRAYDLIQKSDISEEHLAKIQEHIGRMNDIQAKLLNVDPKKSKVGKRPPLNESTSEKPDQLPYLWEGDIVLNDHQMDEMYRNAKDMLWTQKPGKKRPVRSMTSDLSLRWTFPIPYYVNLATGVNEAAILAGVQRWQTDTCVTFTRLSSLPISNALNFILGDGCYSYIGRQGSTQVVSIGVGCDSLGTVTHEIGHALGFYHEQARYDRDSYVDILTQNIQNIYLSQFSKQSFSSMIDYGVGYDLGSVMHYPSTAFSSDGQYTISTLDQNYQMTIGQRVAPSFADVKRINLAYCNSSCSIQLNCQNGGYTDPKSCNQCRCPDAFGGSLCERAATNPSSCGAGDLVASSFAQTIQAQGAVSCSYVITAPPGKKILYQIGAFSFTYWNPCTIDYLEIKYGSEFVSTGARFCYNYPQSSLSATNQLVVIYSGSSSSRFLLNYRYDPPDTVPVTAPPSPSPATTTATIPQWTPAPTTRPSIWTFFPQTSTLGPQGCSAWSDCTALCGACGTRSRSCNGFVESQVCNVLPCERGFCCAPYRYNGRGQCARQSFSSSMDEEAETVEGSGQEEKEEKGSIQ